MQINVWAPQVPLNVQRRRAAQQHIARNYRIVNVDECYGGSGELSAASLQSGDY